MMRWGRLSINMPLLTELFSVGGVMGVGGVRP